METGNRVKENVGRIQVGAYGMRSEEHTSELQSPY